VRLLAGRVNECAGIAYDSLRRRVATTLLRLHEQAPDAAIQLSRGDLAAVVGIAPESLIRTLTEFKHDGLIEQTPGHPGGAAGETAPAQLATRPDCAGELSTL
jgi:CRP-like cAMP-binding protein